MDTKPANAIPKETAERLCMEIREQNRGKWYTFNGLWCLVCAKQAGNDTAKMCFSNKNVAGYRGCTQVNKRFDSLMLPPPS